MLATQQNGHYKPARSVCETSWVAYLSPSASLSWVDFPNYHDKTWCCRNSVLNQQLTEISVTFMAPLSSLHHLVQEFRHWYLLLMLKRTCLCRQVNMNKQHPRGMLDGTPTKWIWNCLRLDLALRRRQSWIVKTFPYLTLESQAKIAGWAKNITQMREMKNA